MKYILEEEEFDKLKNQEKFNKEEFKKKIQDSIYKNIQDFISNLVNDGALRNYWNEPNRIGSPKTESDLFIQISNYRKSFKKLEEDIKNTLNKL